MDWAQVIAIVGTNIGLCAVFGSFVIWAINRIDADINKISTRMDSHAQRIDQLYHMFVDLLKEVKK